MLHGLRPQESVARDTPVPDRVGLAFARPTSERVMPGWLRGAEWGAVTGVLAFTLGPLPMYGRYLWRNWWLLSPDTWQMIIAQVVTYLVVAGALWGAFVGAVIHPLMMRQRVGLLLRAQAGTVAGAVGCLPAGVVAAAHFGQMPTPYFGGVEILVATVGVILVAGMRFATLAGAQTPLRALGRTLAVLPFMAIVALPLAALPPSTLSLELSDLRGLAARVGLVALGAIVGAVLGGIGGCWMALITALGRRRTADLS